MKVLIIGQGGREHALAWKLSKSPRVRQIFIAPGNAGTAEIGQNIPIGVMEFEKLRNWARENEIDLTVVAQDDALGGGIVDVFQKTGLRVFGPNQKASIIEASKVWAKKFFTKYGILTAKYQAFSNSIEAQQYAKAIGTPCVIKAHGLALGKGAIVCRTPWEAGLAIYELMEKKILGAAGEQIVIEEFLEGPECSIHAFCDGETFRLLPTAQDHKQIYDGDQGPMTGGMGTYSPVPTADKLISVIEQSILQPTLKGLKEEGIDFRGVLFAGLKLTSDGPKVLEYNARFGDPETQVLLPRLENDLVDLMDAVIDRKLASIEIRTKPEVAVCVVLASGGYPGKYKKGEVITGLGNKPQSPSVQIFHAGTAVVNGQIVTNGGRVLGVAAQAGSLSEALKLAYDVAGKIQFSGKYHRTDIGAKSLGLL